MFIALPVNTNINHGLQKHCSKGAHIHLRPTDTAAPTLTSLPTNTATPLPTATPNVPATAAAKATESADAILVELDQLVWSLD